MDRTEQSVWSCPWTVGLDIKLTLRGHTHERNTQRTEDIGQLPETFVIGISGCTSSGKTTLTLLLDVVLQQALRRIVSSDGKVVPRLPAHNVVIHQDDYFIERQTRDPPPTVMMQPLWPEDRLVARMTGPDDPPILVENRDRVGSCDDEMFAEHVCGLDTAPDTNTPFSRHPLRDQDQDSPPPSLATEAALSKLSPGTLDTAVWVLRTALRDVLTRDPSKLASLTKQRVRLLNHGVPGVAKRFALVEGFTLLARDPDPNPSGHLLRGDGEARGLRSLRRIQDRLDVCLFLPVEHEEARRRRFERDEYVDVPEGRRKPGQYYKCGGYFDQVAW
ncbi:hypothetical protein F4677DRAFT_415120 [Hypoxylon crocopeplum]|nr:hypothetical protein F4677DRAFT_415120 [Hypoxylon crocopeplum]